MGEGADLRSVNFGDSVSSCLIVPVNHHETFAINALRFIAVLQSFALSLFIRVQLIPRSKATAPDGGYAR